MTDLLRRVRERSAAALASGALVPLHTEGTHLDSDGLRFSVRILARLDAKEAARIAPRSAGRHEAGCGSGPAQIPVASSGEAPPPEPDPFLPYDEDLYVCDVGPAHVCLLNKFNVVDRHVLVVTRAFEEQCALLDAADLGALWSCMRGFPGLGFYNAGEQAGASQRHQHLQLVPLPLSGLATATSFEPWIEEALANGATESPRLPFAHALASVRDVGEDGGEALLERYLGLLERCGVDRRGGRVLRAAGGNWARQPYNLLLTRAWMMVVPRSCESFGGVSINALGYAGSLLVRDRAALARLAEPGVVAVLRAVGRPRA